MSELESNGTLPPEMYQGGFRDSAKVVGTLIDSFGITKPTTIYYPGSSSDVSLLGVTDARVIHADSYLTDEMLSGFSSLGAEAHKVDAHEWNVPVDTDMVVFINPSGINENQVLAKSRLRPGGLILWYFWSGKPKELKEAKGIQLLGAINFGEDEGFEIDTEQLDDYFTYKSFDELSESEQQDFIKKFKERYKLKDDASFPLAYAQLQEPDNYRYAADMSWGFPYKKEASCFVFQKS